MFDLKVHVLRGRTFHVIRGPVLDSHLAGDHCHHDGQPVPQRGVRVRHRPPRRGEDPAGGRSGAPPPDDDHGLWSGPRRPAGVRHHRRHAPAPPVVWDFAQHRRRRDDGLLRGRALASDRRQARPVAAGQADHHGGRRRAERDHLHAPIPTRTPRHPDARLQGAVHPRHLRAGGRGDAPGGGDRSGPSDQDERLAAGRPAGGRRGGRTTERGRCERCPSGRGRGRTPGWRGRSRRARWGLPAAARACPGGVRARRSRPPAPRRRRHENPAPRRQAMPPDFVAAPEAGET